MSVIQWPSPISEQGRLAESGTARARGLSSLNDGSPGCPKVLHVNLFFDGTNNNIDWDTEDKDAPTHTNVARLFAACSDKRTSGEYAYYIPGVGTPFPEIGENEFSSLGKALALGFGMRVGWGYTRLLNALHHAMSGPDLLNDDDAKALCSAMDDEVMATNGTIAKIASKVSMVPGVSLIHSGFTRYSTHKSEALLTRLHGELAALQKKNSGPGGQLDRSIKKVHVNVFGFSRGAASARVFVNQLITKWAKDNMIAGAIPYEVNFLGLFDTVASVGIPDTATAAINIIELDGHWMWTAHGALNVPKAVKKCVHFFSIHEQRMSFPLDTIREEDVYPGGEARRIEVAYPGVHSDVGGGYPVSDQGKSLATKDRGEGEGSKLSQVALHNMYIEALKAGVPLMLQPDISKRIDLVNDFSLSPKLAHTFNDWLSTVSTKPLDSVEMALRVGMSQSLAWRTLRADIQNPQNHVTAQNFYKQAQEDPLTPFGMETQLASKSASSAQIATLQKEKAALQATRARMKLADFNTSMTSPVLAIRVHQQVARYDKQIEAKDKQIIEATAGPGKHSRPGEDATDITTNCKTDLLEAAEEFRLLLAYLRPNQRTHLQIDWAIPPDDSVRLPYGASKSISQNPRAYYLTVNRQVVATHGRQGSRTAWMGEHDRVIQLIGATAPYQDLLDFVLTPSPEMLPFLLEHTSDNAVQKLSPAVINLLDNYVHDSRAWFRVPYFHEYAPGGFGWARTLFVGGDRRVRHLGFPAGSASVAAQRDAQATAELGNFIAARSATMPPARVNFNFNNLPGT